MNLSPNLMCSCVLPHAIATVPSIFILGLCLTIDPFLKLARYALVLVRAEDLLERARLKFGRGRPSDYDLQAFFLGTVSYKDPWAASIPDIRVSLRRGPQTSAISELSKSLYLSFDELHTRCYRDPQTGLLYASR